MLCADLLQQGRYEEIEKRIDPSMKNGKTRETLAEMASYFPSKPISTKTVEASVVRSRDSSITRITLEYEFERSWLLTQLVIQTKDGVKTISGFHVTPIAESVEVMNEFTFAGKGISQYASLILAIFVSIFALKEFVVCIRTKTGRERWFWAILILIGAVRVTLNWTTGQLSLTPLAVQAPPCTMACTPYGPWMLHISAPLGAIAFFVRRKALAEKVTASRTQSPTIAQ